MIIKDNKGRGKKEKMEGKGMRYSQLLNKKNINRKKKRNEDLFVKISRQQPFLILKSSLLLLDTGSFDLLIFLFHLSKSCQSKTKHKKRYMYKTTDAPSQHH